MGKYKVRRAAVNAAWRWRDSVPMQSGGFKSCCGAICWLCSLSLLLTQVPLITLVGILVLMIPLAIVGAAGLGTTAIYYVHTIVVRAHRDERHIFLFRRARVPCTARTGTPPPLCAATPHRCA